MGASTFSVAQQGPTAAAAFEEAIADAKHECGHGGYTGSIAEKATFVLITREPLSFEAALALSERLLDGDDGRVSDKWGPAGCIPLLAGGWLFFGWAAS